MQMQYVFANYTLSPGAAFSRWFAPYIRRGSALAARMLNMQAPFVLTLDDVDPKFLCEFASYLLQEGRVEDAIAYYEKALEIATNAPEVAAESHCNLGVVLVQQGGLPEAIVHFERARLLVREGSLPEAAAEQDLSELYLLLGQAYEMGGHTEKALAAYAERDRLGGGRK